MGGIDGVCLISATPRVPWHCYLSYEFGGARCASRRLAVSRAPCRRRGAGHAGVFDCPREFSSGVLDTGSILALLAPFPQDAEPPWESIQGDSLDGFFRSAGVS